MPGLFDLQVHQPNGLNSLTGMIHGTRRFIFRFKFIVVDFPAKLAVGRKDCADNGKFCMEVTQVAVIACYTTSGPTLYQFTLPNSHIKLL